MTKSKNSTGERLIGYERRIIVTGGLGFIGSNYLNKFVGIYPTFLFVNIDAMTYAGRLSNVTVSHAENYAFEKADIRDIESLEKIFKRYNPTDIIHFAAESHVDLSISNPSIFIETNIVGTHNLLLLAKKHSINRFHQISTDEVYGSLEENDPPFTLKSPIAPNSPYSASKASADQLVRAYNKTFGLNTVITRCSNNYGPFQDESKLIPKAILSLLRGRKVPVYGQGENIRDWIYVEDHIDAINMVFHKGMNGRIYNVGGDSEVRNIDLVQKLIKMTGRNVNDIVFVEDRRGHDYRYALDNSEIKKELKWRPRVSLSRGLKKTLAYYESVL